MTDPGDRIPTPLVGDLDVPPDIDAAEFRATLGEDVASILDLNTWRRGEDLEGVFERLDQEVAEAVQARNRQRKAVRDRLFPLITPDLPEAAPNAGVFAAKTADLRHVQENVLFNSGVEACDTVVAGSENFGLSIYHIAACLVSYDGEQGSWAQRLYRREIQGRGGNAVEEALAVLERRQARADAVAAGKKDAISELIRRGVTATMERSVLVDKAGAPWRMGRGHPAPYEMITGSGSIELLDAALDVIRRLVLDHKRFVFVPDKTSDGTLWMIGDALDPLEFAIIETAQRKMRKTIESGHYWPSRRAQVDAFFRDVAPEIVVGVYRISRSTPPFMFYAHADHAEEAALIAMADSALQAHRGFPILIDIARNACETHIGTEGFSALIQSAYAGSGDPLASVGSDGRT